jgi:hypothetical protein
LKTTVLVRLAVDRTTMTVRDLATGHTEFMRADPGVLAQIERDVTEAYFEAWVEDGEFSFGDRVPPPGDDD